MTFLRNEEAFLRSNDVWIISNGRHTKFDLSVVREGMQTAPVVEYRISELARYLLNPNPIEVKKILVGCEVHYRKPFGEKATEKLRRILPQGMHGLFKQKWIGSETFMVKRDKNAPVLKDEDLDSYVEKIQSALRGYDPILKNLSRIDRDEVFNITGICEDIGGNRSLLNLRGDTDEKISYIASYLLKDVGVVLEKAHISDGLFEMSGFDFASFDAKSSYRLIKYFADGRPKCCVIGMDGNVEYWIDDPNLINQMHLLEHSLKENPKFNNSLSLCTRGDARPLRLLFKKQLDIDYTKSPLPALYRNLFDTYDIGTNKKNALMRSLQNSQLGILFNYVPLNGKGEKKLFTNVSVMHDVRALDPIKEDFPELYSMVNKMASISEAGKYYLLDSIRGFSNE